MKKKKSMPKAEEPKVKISETVGTCATGGIKQVKHICVDCKKNEADLIRGIKDYLCVQCFKKYYNIK